MKKILVGLVALVLLGGGGAGAYFFFMKPAEASTSEDGVEEHAENKHAKDDGHGGGGLEFVELDPLILPIVDGSGVSQTISIVISLEVEDSYTKDKVLAMEPRLKDAYIQDLYGALNKHAALKGGVLQVDILKARLNKVSAKVAGEDVVQDVLLQVVQQRTM